MPEAQPSLEMASSVSRDGGSHRLHAAKRDGVVLRWLLGYLAVLVFASVLEATATFAAAVSVHIGLIAVLCLLGGSARGAPVRPMLTPLVVVSTMRVITMSLPVPSMALTTRTAAIGAVSVLALALAVPMGWDRIVHFARDRPTGHTDPPQFAIGLLGLPIGVLAYLTLHPRPSVPNGLAAVLIEVLVLVALSAAPEEILFRGVLAPATRKVVGSGSTLCDGAIYACVYAGSRSIPFLCLMFAVGAGGSALRLRTGRLWGLFGAHAVASVVALVILPALF